MPQVPYSPVPNAPGHIPAPTLNVTPQADAFGASLARANAGVGAAIEGLGGTISKASDEIFSRAIAIQDLRNDTEAKEADAQYMMSIGALHADYSALQGKAKVDAYPGYMEAIQKIRQDMRKALSNDDARRKFDGNSLSTMGRTIFNGAGEAATAQKQWAARTIKAQNDLDAKTVEDNPRDDVLFQDKLNRVRIGTQELSALQGHEPGSPVEKELYLSAASKLLAQRITGLSRTAPFEALDMLNKFKNGLTADDFLRVDNTVRTQARAVGSVNIANEVYAIGRGTDTVPAKSLKDMEDEARARAKAIDPNDPILAQHAVAALRGVYNQDKYAARQEDLNNIQIIDGAILKGVRDERELRMDPKVAAAMDALPKDKRLAIPGMINRYNDARNKTTNQDTYQILFGRSNNDVEAFLNTDLTKEPLSQADMRSLQKRQQELKKNQYADPRVDRAIAQIRGAMGPQLEALGIFRRTPVNKDDYDHFTGAVQSALDVWTQSKGKPPTYQEVIKDIAPEILKQRTVPGFFNIGGYGTENKKPFFKQDVPAAWARDLKADVVSKGGVEPTDQEVYKAYVRSQFIKLYEKKINE